MTRTTKEKLPIYIEKHIRINYVYLPKEIFESLEDGELQVYNEGSLETLWEVSTRLRVYPKSEEFLDDEPIDKRLLPMIKWARKHKINIVHFDGSFMPPELPILYQET